MAESEIKELEHFLPNIGLLSCRLYRESKEVYSGLDEKGEITRFRQLGQLGLVQHVWQSARHTRWDFTMLILDIIRRALPIESIHLKSKVNIGGGTTISSAQELLSCWALLLPVGHLHGTLFTENELLFALRQPANDNAKRELIKSAASKAGQDWIASAIANERGFQFHQALALYRLKALFGQTDRRASWDAILTAYVAPHDQESLALTRARTLFRAIRRLAYLHLDSSSTPTVMAIRLPQLASSPLELERLLSPQYRNDYGDELSSLADYMSRAIYNGREVLLRAEQMRQGFRRDLQTGLRRSGLKYVIQSYAKTDPCGVARFSERDLTVVMRGEVAGPLFNLVNMLRPAALPRDRTERAFAKWAARQGADARLQLVRDAGGDQLMIQVHAKGPSRQNVAAGLAGSILLARHIRRQANGFFRASIDQIYLARVYEDILFGALSFFFDSTLRFEWDESHLNLRALGGDKPAVVAAFDRHLADGSLSPSRKYEIACTREVAKRIQADYLLASVANIIGFREAEAPMICEIDGLVAGVDSRRGDLVLGILEAKRSAKRAEANCRRQLREQLSSHLQTDGIRRGQIRSEGGASKAFAWRYLRFAFRT